MTDRFAHSAERSFLTHQGTSKPRKDTPMLNTFLEKAGGMLGRYFLLTCWVPTFIAGVLALVVSIMPLGLDRAWTWWQAQSEPTQFWLSLGGLLIVTATAYLLQAFTRSLTRLYEGYWPHRIRQWAIGGVERRWENLRRERRKTAKEAPSKYASLQAQMHHDYPLQIDRLLPTRLGNVLCSAEMYPETAYGLAPTFWWPRLVPLLPEALRKEIEYALTPLLALLNLATLTGVVGVGGALYLWQRQVWGGWGGLVTLAGGLLGARLAYRGAVDQARSYGLLIRAAFDLHRFALLEALHHPLPESPKAERASWAQLEDWLYNQNRGAVEELTYRHE
jgi:hypothetical protein